MNAMMDLLNKIDGLFIAPVSDGADIQNKILCEELPFKVHEYESGKEHNGWIIPQKWEVIKAEITKDGKLIYDGTKHPLGVIGYSEGFEGTVPLDELKKHLYFSEDAPDEIVYHCDSYYKPHRKLWGFSIPFSLFKNLKEGDYRINLITSHQPGKMKVLEYCHQGKSDKTIIFNAHNCHAAQLNDGPAGYAVFIEVLKRLRNIKTNYSYKLIIAPEHLGTVFYLANLPVVERKKCIFGIFLEMVGHDNPVFALQESFTGQSLIDKIATHVLKHYSREFWRDGFRKIIGNDESVWEAPGYEIPMISLSRCSAERNLYPQYHLSSDNIKIIKEEKLQETVLIIEKIINIIDNNYYLKRNFEGLISLSNPRYDLYIPPGTDPSEKLADKFENRAKWFDLMNCLSRYFDDNMTIFEISEKHDLPFELVYQYILKFKGKGLIDFSAKEVY